MAHEAPDAARTEALRAMSDREVVEAYEAASAAYDEPAMDAAADEMQRRNLDY
ncbi:hypothetical protein [Sphingomonas melonis]|uniref:hypothetical protein n=1 Tax=Sphingomonas melonis TaxID=152682 RepID=UPI0035C80AF5